MPLGIGSKLLHYKITAKLGKGGMGEVWRARDTKLGRYVALKVLPPEMAADRERLERFQREAKSVAALNHPNIVTLYAVEEANGTPFLTMELVEGSTLGKRIPKEGLPLQETFDVAIPVADAIAAAHDKGITHRDLKPDNVMIDDEGRVKVLDFGLAKVGADTASGSEIATVTAALTQDGRLLGTVAYMSPEQAEGSPVDGRSDIFSLGVLLYEMVTGRRPFQGDSAASVITSVLRDTPPPVSEVKPGSPRQLARIVRHCLEKDPRRRFQSARDVAIQLEDLREELAAETVQSASGETMRGRAAISERRLRPLVAIGVPGAIVAAFASGWLLRPEPPTFKPPIADEVRTRQLTFDPAYEFGPSFSPDGNVVAYASDDRGPLDIVLLPLATGDVRRLVASPADDAQPAWSPDGTQIAFTSARDGDGKLHPVPGLRGLGHMVTGSGGDLFVVAATGGSPIKLVDRGSYPAWSPDGREIAFQSNRSGRWDIWKIPSQGGTPVALTDDDLTDYQPAWSPGGRWIVFASRGGLRLVAADGSAAPVRIEDPSFAATNVLTPAWSPDGRWIYFASDRHAPAFQTRLWRFAFDPENPPAAHLAGVAKARLDRITLGGSTQTFGPVLSRDGRRLVYSEMSYGVDLCELDIATNDVRRVTATASTETRPHVSPDGKRLVYFSDRGGRVGVWMLDLETGEESPISVTHAAANMSRWSPDGERVAYHVAGDSIVVQEVGTLSVKKIIAQTSRDNGFVAWSPDGDKLAISRPGPAGGEEIVITDLDGNAFVLPSPEGSNLEPTFSPDGRTVAFQHSSGEGPHQAWVVPVEGGEARALPAPPLDLYHPQWSPVDADKILVVVDHKSLATLSVASGQIDVLTDVDRPPVVVDFPSWSWDGRRVYFGCLWEKAGDLFLLDGI